MIYLSGPITEKDGFTMRENAESATDIYLRLINKGINCFCPHLNVFIPNGIEVKYERWMEYDFAIIDLCTDMLMLPRWETSSGAQRERVYAKKQGLHIYYDISEIIEVK